MPAYKTFERRPRTHKRTDIHDTKRQAVNHARKSWGNVALVVLQFAETGNWKAFPFSLALSQAILDSGSYPGLDGAIALSHCEKVEAK